MGTGQMATATTDIADASRAELAAGDAGSIAPTCECPTSPAAQARLQRLHAFLDHEIAYASSKQAERDLDRRSELTPRFRSWEDQVADAAGQPAIGPL